MDTRIVIVGMGGGLGTMLRYLCGGIILHVYPQPLLPWGTVAVNVVGCLLIGLISGAAEHHHLFGPSMRLFLITGVLGGFTTFSAFGYETLVLARTTGLVMAALYVLLSVVLGLGAVLLGYWLVSG